MGPPAGVAWLQGTGRMLAPESEVSVIDDAAARSRSGVSLTAELLKVLLVGRAAADADGEGCRADYPDAHYGWG